MKSGSLHLFLPPSLFDESTKHQKETKDLISYFFHCRALWENRMTCSHPYFCCSSNRSCKLWFPKLFYSCFYNLSFNIYFLGYNFKILSKPIEKLENKKQEIQGFYSKSYNSTSSLSSSISKRQKGEKALKFENIERK